MYWLSEWQRIRVYRYAKCEKPNISNAHAHLYTLTFFIVQWIRKNRWTVKRHFYTFFTHNMLFILLCSAIDVFRIAIYIVKICELNEEEYVKKGLNPNRIMNRFGWTVTFTPFYLWVMKAKISIEPFLLCFKFGASQWGVESIMPHSIQSDEFWAFFYFMFQFG